MTRANFWLGFRIFERQLLSVAMRLVFVLLAILAATAVNAQDTAEISGVVRDSSQAPVAGVRITVINQATRSEAISYTDKDGFYQAGGLEPQYYTVETFRVGLQTVIRRDLHVRPGARLGLDLELALASGGWFNAGSRDPWVSVLDCAGVGAGLAFHHRAWPKASSKAVGAGRVGG